MKKWANDYNVTIAAHKNVLVIICHFIKFMNIMFWNNSRSESLSWQGYWKLKSNI